MDYRYKSLDLYMVPLRSDNYSYIIHDRETKKTLVIDPSENEALVTFIKDKGFSLDLIIDTHHHDDHTHGNISLQDMFKSEIIASRYDQDKNRIPGQVGRTLKDGDRFEFSGYHFRAISTAGHTLGHVCLLLEEANWLFSGDTLFGLGCGRLFEGTPEIMWESLQKLRALPDDSLVFCGHEYTLSNARFARHVASNLPGLKGYLDSLEKRFKEEGRTVPSRLSDEKAFNPFLLADHPFFKSLGDDPAAVFGNLRKQKDNFK
ncbi:MAG: hydroxyacylglutathione hydrolase [Proteobacteria bacterium]|nr:MAG: hydroxyacylglutathione hydrolase [Pseudomonadota bacterium]